jgi:hypothetical protein
VATEGTCDINLRAVEQHRQVVASCVSRYRERAGRLMRRGVIFQSIHVHGPHLHLLGAVHVSVGVLTIVLRIIRRRQVAHGQQQCRLHVVVCYGLGAQVTAIIRGPATCIRTARRELPGPCTGRSFRSHRCRRAQQGGKQGVGGGEGGVGSKRLPKLLYAAVAPVQCTVLLQHRTQTDGVTGQQCNDSTIFSRGNYRSNALVTHTCILLLRTIF